jgi:dienelactone hydrolase
MPASAPEARGGEKPKFIAGHFDSGDKTIRVERYEPAKEGRYPAVIFLYGIDGLHAGNEEAFRGVARAQADRGYVVLIVHYFDCIPGRPKEMKALQKDLGVLLFPQKQAGNQAQAAKYFKAWKGVVRDALVYARAQKSVDKDRVGLVGLSLGGFLAAAVSSEPEQRVKGVVTLFAGIPPETAAKLKHFPAALILTADKDVVVPPCHSEVLRDLLKKSKVPAPEYNCYRGVCHCWQPDGPGYPAKLNAAICVKDAQGRVTTFLCRCLEPKGGK